MDIIVIGFALFAMFFGAGNLIFPPQLGNVYGSNWLVASIGFVLTGVGITALAVISMAKKRGDIFEFTSVGGDKLGKLVTLLICLAIGPLGAIPRTGATSAEIIIAAGINIPFGVFVLIFFALSLYFALAESAVIDIIGKYLTPTLLVVLAIMIVSGIISPIGPIEVSEDSIGRAYADSIVEGYNTMDAIAALAFTPIIVRSVIEKGYENTLVKTTIKSSLIAVLGLALVYVSLTYLGATTSVVDNNIESRVELLIHISSAVLGSAGKYILSLIIILACFTTSIGLITSIAGIFEQMVAGKYSYRSFVFAITGVSLVLSLLGVDDIVKFVFPFLSFVYPITILMIIYNMMDEPVNDGIRKVTFSVVGIIAFIQGLAELASAVSIEKGAAIGKIIGWIPLADYGFPWFIPFLIALGIGLIFFNEDRVNKAKITKKFEDR